jgi:DNA-binding transcriptional LysR family regulator
MTIDLRWLQSFLAAAEELNFSRAARRLHLAQPALTAHIRQLEEAVDAQLFDRSNRIHGLTPAGKVLLGEAQAVVARAQGLKEIAMRAQNGEAARYVWESFRPPRLALLRMCSGSLPGNFHW